MEVEGGEWVRTRPDTRPPVADGWAGAEMCVFTLFDSMVTDQRTDRRTDKASNRVACPQLKRGRAGATQKFAVAQKEASSVTDKSLTKNLISTSKNRQQESREEH